MANLTKLAKTGAVLTLIGAISLTGVAYVSQAGGINGVIEQLKARALGWKDVAEHNKAEYNKLKAVYDDMLKLLGLQEGASYEQIKAKIDDLVKNADVAGIDNVNDLLYELATSLGVQDQLVKNESTGVYDPQPIYEALRTMEDNLDQAITKIGDTKNGINKEASGKVTYSDDMTLVEKINYLIAQINNANSDQVAIKNTADEALEAVAEATDEDKVTSPVEKTEPSNPGGVQDTNKTPKQQAWDNFMNSLTCTQDIKDKLVDGTYSVNVRERAIVTSGTTNVQYNLNDRQMDLYNTWYNMAE